MFESIVNSLLEKYLAPYLDNMSASNLRFRLGKMSAKNLKLKSSLCALLGFDELQLQVGELKVLEIEVPFFALLSGGITVTLEKLEVDAVINALSDGKSGEQRLEELRQTRIASVEHQAAQQIEVRKHQRLVEAAKQEGRDLDAGMVAKVARHFISNVKIQISNLQCRLSDPESGAHVAAELGELYGRAPTEEEREKATTTQTEVEVARSTSSFQAIGFKNFCIKGGYQVSQDILTLHFLQVILLQGHGNMAVEIDFGLKENSDSVRLGVMAGMKLSPDQITALIKISNALGEESNRLQALLVPPGAEQMVNLTTKKGIKKADDEYVSLCSRYYRDELEGAVPGRRLPELTMSEEFRLKVLRDVVPLKMQAEWFMPVMQDLQEARRRDSKKHRSWPTKMLQSFSCWAEDSGQGDPHKIMKELHNEAEVTAGDQMTGLKDVVVPNNLSMELQIGTLQLRLDGDDGDAILLTTLKSVGLVAGVTQGVDYRGEQSADFKIDFVLQSFSITHHAADMLRFGTAKDKPAFKVTVDNRLEETRNVVALDVAMQPLELFFDDSILRELRKLQSEVTATATPSPAREAQLPVLREDSLKSQQKKKEKAEDEEVLQSYYQMGKAWMETSSGQEMLQEAKKRTPDELEIHVELQAPRVYFPVRGKAAVHISLGVLEVESHNLTPDAGELVVKLQPAAREPVLAVVTLQGVKHPMISMRPLITTMTFNDACARVIVQLESMEVEASPDLIQILATVPAVLQDAMALEAANLRDKKTEEEQAEEMAEEVKREEQKVAKVAAAVAEEKPTRILQAILDIQNIGIMLNSDIDRSAPVLRLFVALRSVEVCQQGSSISMPLETMALSEGAPCKQMMRLRADGFNLEVGRFEPLLEPFALSCQLHKDDAAGIDVHIFGRKPLLLNLNPFTLRRLQWYSTRLAGSIVPMPPEAQPVPVRYALLNLSAVPIGLCLKLQDKPGQICWMDVPPTGQAWRCLDRIDFAFPPSLGVAVAKPHLPAQQRQTERLDLGLLNSVRIPNSNLMVQLLRPSVLGAVILVSSKVLIFNETSVPLALRFDSAIPLVWTSCATSAIVDGSSHLTESDIRQGQTPGAVPSWLMPGAFASVPLELPQQDEDDEDDEGATIWEVMMKTQPNQWGRACINTSSSFADIQCGNHHVLAVVDYNQSAPPACEEWLRIKLLPPLQLTSCLPCKVEVQYYGQDEEAESAREVILSETDTVQIYDLPFPQSVRLRARISGGTWSTWGYLELNEEDIGEQDRMMSRLEAEMQVEPPDAGEFTFALLDKGNGKVQLCCQTWLIDRTGWNLGVSREGPLVDAGHGVLLCGNNMKYHKIISNGKCSTDFSLPSGYNDHTVTSTPEGVFVTVRARPLVGQEEDIVRCLEIVPRVVVQNDTGQLVEFRSGDGRATIRPGEMSSPKFTAETAQFRSQDAVNWSTEIPITEDVAGTASISVGSSCYTLDIRTENGVIFILLLRGSKFALCNKTKHDCEMRVRNMHFRAGPGAVVDFAWTDPFDKDKDMEAELILDDEDFPINPRITYHKRLRGRMELCSSFEKTKHFLEVRERNDEAFTDSAVTLNLVLPRIGVSLMGRAPRQVRISELLYLELALLQVVATTKPKQDKQMLHVALGDLQLDYQVPNNPLQHCVILGNRGASGRRLARSVFQLHAERCQISSPDVHLSTLSFRLDELEVSVDDTLISTMLGVADILMPASSSKTAAGFPMSSVERVREKVGQAILEPRSIPAPAAIFQIDDLIMSAISVKIWARIRLKRVACMLPSWAIGLVGALSLSDSMSMEGATIALSPKYLKHLHGKVADLASGFVREWMGNMLRSVASVLGHSSLLAIPRAPVDLIEAAGSFASDHAPSSGFVDAMTFDPEYAARHKHQRQQPIRGASEGMSTAVSSFGQGISGMLDVFRRPVEGAKNDGVKGFVKGIGTGFVSGMVKGVTGIKDAAMDFGRGLVAEVNRKINPTQEVKRRVRHPRATYGPVGAVLDYSELDAHVIAYIHSQVDPSYAIEAIVPLFKWEQPKVQADSDGELGPSFEVMVLTHDKVLLAEVPYLRLYEVESFYPDAGYERSHPNMVHTRFLQHLRSERPSSQRSRSGQFQIRQECPYSSVRSVRWATGNASQKPPLLLETGRQGSQTQLLEVLMPWSVCDELPSATCSLLSSIDSGVLPPKKVEILQHTLATLRSSLQGDELENKTVVDEECWEVQRAAIAAGFESGWQPPFLPTEPEQQQGWLAEGLEKRHPLLDLTRSNSRKKKGPPMRQLRFWKPNGTWQREINEHTDGEGWQYATGWGSRDWRASPRIMLDVVRARKWTMKYTLNFVAQINSKAPSPWLSLPMSVSPSAAPSVSDGDSLPPLSAPVSAEPSPKRHGHRHEREEPNGKPGTIAARQLHALASDAHLALPPSAPPPAQPPPWQPPPAQPPLRQQPASAPASAQLPGPLRPRAAGETAVVKTLPLERRADRVQLAYPRACSVTSPSSVQSMSFVRSPMSAVAPTQMTPRPMHPQAVGSPQVVSSIWHPSQRSVQATSMPVYRPQVDVLASSRSSVASRVSASRPQHPSIVQRR
ncbi:unnamed protein product [Cladocopium goreaui]|uniref:Uncharacterized protein n=1 Tax=Cladocopium goreaui TaxID=2562237 RepID=A0A9P1CEV7_9DINO|nr:unnamed protein product [Cladocopium goreaui]